MTHKDIRQWIASDTDRIHSKWEDMAKTIILQLLDELDGKKPLLHDTTNLHGLDFLKVDGRSGPGANIPVKIGQNESLIPPYQTEDIEVKRNWDPKDLLKHQDVP